MTSNPYLLLNIEGILASEKAAPKRNVIWRSHAPVEGQSDPGDPNLVEIAEHGINIVSGTDTKANVRRSMTIGLELAAQGKKILYVNAIASLETIRAWLVHHLEHNEQVKSNAETVKANFQMMHIRMGMWEQSWQAVEDAIIHSDSPADMPENVWIDTKLCDVLVLNSYDLAAVFYKEKMHLVNKVVEWSERVELTVVLFTHGQPKQMSAGVPVRGPLGLLTVQAATLWKLDAVPMRSHRDRYSTNTRPLPVRHGGAGVYDSYSSTLHEQIPNGQRKKIYRSPIEELESVLATTTAPGSDPDLWPPEQQFNPDGTTRPEYTAAKIRWEQARAAGRNVIAVDA
jgi:hypothetical protein